MKPEYVFLNDESLQTLQNKVCMFAADGYEMVKAYAIGPVTVSNGAIVHKAVHVVWMKLK